MDNGSHVTRAELDAHLKPMRDDISEIRDDVKTLLREQAGEDAVIRYRDRAASYRRWLIGCVIALAAVLVAAASALLTFYIGGH